MSRLCSQLGRFSTLFTDDLDYLVKKYEHIDHLFDGKSYFVRTENVSLKYGYHGNIRIKC